MRGESRHEIGAYDVLPQATRHLDQRLVADVMSKRRVDLGQVANVDQDERKRCSRVVLEQAVELNLRIRAIRQARERVVIGKMSDAGLAIGNTRLHCIERRRKLAKVFRSTDLHGAVVAAFFDTASRRDQCGNRLRRASPRKQANAHRGEQRDGADQQHRVAHVAIRRHHRMHRPLHQHRNGIRAGEELSRHTQELRRPELQPLRAGTLQGLQRNARKRFAF